MAEPAHDIASIFIELGASVVGLAVLARVAIRWGFSAIPSICWRVWRWETAGRNIGSNAVR
jgi:hypothetical protein